jgi:glycosyltransferase involved in cell wall biosynthesis
MESKKKILFFHHCATIGGAGLSGLNVLKAIPKEKYDVTVYCNSEIPDMAELYRNAGFNVIFAGKSPAVFVHFSGGELFALSPNAIINYISIYLDRKNIFTAINKIQPDIVIINSMTLFWIGKIAKKINAETICFFRETFAKNLLGIRNKIIRFNLNKYIDKISFISKYDQDKCKNLNCQCTTIYNMIPHQDFLKLSKPKTIEYLGLNEKNYNVLYVGGMSPLKGAIVAIRALSRVKNQNIKLVFIGFNWDGNKKLFSHCISIKSKIKYMLGIDYEANCINYIIENRLKDRILFFDVQKDISPFYVACDALISPSTKPHQARPIFEAGFAKIPVIASDFPNIRESIDEESGFLFKNKDSEELAFILDSISKNPRSYTEKIITNYKKTMNRHVADIFNPSIVNLLEINSSK